MPKPPSLLLRLGEASDHEAWTRFVKLYTPLMYYWSHRAGLAKDEADELVKDVFGKLIEALPKFTQDPKSFLGLLRTVTLNQWRENKQKKPTSTPARISKLADPAVTFWEDEFRQHLARRALMLMQNEFPREAWQVCWATVVEGKSAADIAAVMKCDIHNIYRHKFRVLSRLRQELGGMLE